ncbi:MAG: EamA family transporter [Bacteroidetes bacterium]|nr:EamA family transporter [Bacteroidota bacterium]
MQYLIIVSLIWAFSFGLIKGQLTNLDANLVAFLRLFISFLVFLPLFRIKNHDSKVIIKFALIGAVQYGIMYSAYIYSYQYLQAFEIAIFTVFTPIYIVLIDSAIKRSLNKIFLFASLLAVTGAGVILLQAVNFSQNLFGFALVQLSNICFASGQIFYRSAANKINLKNERELFAALFFGGVLITGLLGFITIDFNGIIISTNQIFTLLYLGAIASGISFFLWNKGARLVHAGTLSVMNNLKIPLAVFVSLLIFGEESDLTKLIIGGTVIGLGLWIAERFRTSKSIEQ